MKVKKTSWHYKAIKHKLFIENLKEDNSEAITYIIEVAFAIYVYGVAIFAVLLGLIVLVDPEQLRTIFPTPSRFIIFLVIPLFSHIWFPLLMMAIEPLIKKEWKRLEAID